MYTINQPSNQLINQSINDITNSNCPIVLPWQETLARCGVLLFFCHTKSSRYFYDSHYTDAQQQLKYIYKKKFKHTKKIARFSSLWLFVAHFNLAQFWVLDTVVYSILHKIRILPNSRNFNITLHFFSIAIPCHFVTWICVTFKTIYLSSKFCQMKTAAEHDVSTVAMYRWGPYMKSAEDFGRRSPQEFHSESHFFAITHLPNNEIPPKHGRSTQRSKSCLQRWSTSCLRSVYK